MGPGIIRPSGPSHNEQYPLYAGSHIASGSEQQHVALSPDVTHAPTIVEGYPVAQPAHQLPGYEWQSARESHRLVRGMKKLGRAIAAELRGPLPQKSGPSQQPQTDEQQSQAYGYHPAQQTQEPENATVGLHDLDNPSHPQDLINSFGTADMLQVPPIISHNTDEEHSIKVSADGSMSKARKSSRPPDWTLYAPKRQTTTEVVANHLARIPGYKSNDLHIRIIHQLPELFEKNINSGAYTTFDKYQAWHKRQDQLPQPYPQLDYNAHRDGPVKVPRRTRLKQAASATAGAVVPPLAQAASAGLYAMTLTGG